MKAKTLLKDTEFGGAICWPEQFPGEYEMAKRIWAKADKRWPNRNRDCSCKDNETNRCCNHCAVCGRFMSNMTTWSNEIGGLLAAVGICKIHGEQCADADLWSYTEW
jgi:hypothetical protein